MSLEEERVNMIFSTFLKVCAVIGMVTTGIWLAVEILTR